MSTFTYIALLRGINLRPHKRIKMEASQQAMRELGFEDIKTYIQSGNIVFKDDFGVIPAPQAEFKP